MNTPPTRPLALPKRLQAVASLIEGQTLADIGTDHAHIPIAAVLSGRIERALACDVKPGPLKRAEANIRAFGLQKHIETRLGDGLMPVRPGEAACIVIAGMGGLRIAQILCEGHKTACAARRLILQPAQDYPALRKDLHGMGFHIEDEIIAKEKERFYLIMTAYAAETVTPWSEQEYITGKWLLQRRDSVSREYVAYHIHKLTRCIQAIERKGRPGGDAWARLAALRAERAMYREGDED